ncbi:MAG: hypothetical protein IJP82_01160 [Bacteroidaceae bacterium]|nr:hypothetical protein [Bacteroidaceae bacterium]
MYARKHYYILFVFAVIALASCQEKRKDRFEREAQEYTQTHCPQPYGDGVTILDSMVFIPNDSTIGDLKLYYSLQLTEDQRKAFMDKLGDIGDENLKVVRNSVLFAKHKEAGVGFTYIYHDAATGDKMVEYHFTPEDYK